MINEVFSHVATPRGVTITLLVPGERKLFLTLDELERLADEVFEHQTAERQRQESRERAEQAERARIDPVPDHVPYHGDGSEAEAA